MRPRIDNSGTCIECSKIDPQAVVCRNDDFGGIQILYCQGQFVQNYSECICSDMTLLRTGDDTCDTCPANAQCNGSRTFECLENYVLREGVCQPIVV